MGTLKISKIECKNSRPCFITYLIRQNHVLIYYVGTYHSTYRLSKHLSVHTSSPERGLIFRLDSHVNVRLGRHVHQLLRDLSVKAANQARSRQQIKSDKRRLHTSRVERRNLESRKSLLLFKSRSFEGDYCSSLTWDTAFRECLL